MEPIQLVIAGGGTAGWMTAAALARFLDRHYTITVIESDEIGTIGVGEATIPQILLYNQALGLDENVFLAATGGTFKLGIEFVGWRRPGERYMHAFGAVGRDVGLIPFQHYWLRARAAGFAKPLGAYSLNEIAARDYRMRRGAPAPGSTLPNMPYAFHFDAGLYAAHLRQFAERAGVKRLEGKIEAVLRDGERGDVTGLKLTDGRQIDGDFFVDCTGLRALLVEGALGSGFEEWTRWLPCDRALAVPTASDGDLTPYTRATAKAAGWQWRIPLQHRIGNGLVYCSAFIGEDQAHDTLMRGLTSTPTATPRPLRFTTGRRRTPWSHNVVAIGLSSGFLEPLESTSIHLIQSAISRLLKLLPGRRVAAQDAAEYNRQTTFEMERIRDFIILHYWANHRDEPFWQNCRETALPETLSAKIDLYRANGHIFREHEELFTEVGWLQVFAGQGIEPTGYHPIADQVPEGDLREYLSSIELLYQREAGRMTGHADFIARHCRTAVAA